MSTHRTPVSFSPLALTATLGSPAALGAALLGRYGAEALAQSAALVGSLQLLGNPTRLLRSVGAGLSDALSLPLRGLTEGPRQFVAGLGAGGTSLLMHVSHGALTSVSNARISLTHSLAHTLNSLTHPLAHPRTHLLMHSLAHPRTHRRAHLRLRLHLRRRRQPRRRGGCAAVAAAAAALRQAKAHDPLVRLWTAGDRLTARRLGAPPGLTRLAVLGLRPSP